MTRVIALPATVTLRRLSALILGLLFFLHGLEKAGRPYDFLNAVYDYQLVGADMGEMIARVLPWLEIVIGIALLLSVLERGALALSILLLITFLVAKLSVLSRGLLIPCGCGTRVVDPIGYADVWKGAGFLCVGLLAYWLPSRSSAAMTEPVSAAPGNTSVGLPQSG